MCESYPIYLRFLSYDSMHLYVFSSIIAEAGTRLRDVFMGRRGGPAQARPEALWRAAESPISLSG